mmetsp:Transcript_34811/g.98694  ORF Transcript_34811/g.98694 Transcript_34811/m.98694 type:complete len:110 (-) Transcript_34811:1631-1960(-)
MHASWQHITLQSLSRMEGRVAVAGAAASCDLPGLARRPLAVAESKVAGVMVQEGGRVPLQARAEAVGAGQPLVVLFQLLILRLHLPPAALTENRIRICRILSNAMELQG